MTTQSGLSYFVTNVQAFFTGLATHGRPDYDGVNIVVGRRQPGQQINQGTGGARRIVIVPNGGELGAVTQPGRHRQRPTNPGTGLPARARSLLGWQRSLLAYVWAHDLSNPNDELAQYDAAEDLLEKFVQAAHYTLNGQLDWSTVDDTSGPVERRNGCELVVSLSFSQSLLDVDLETVTPGFTLTPVLNPPPEGA